MGKIGFELRSGMIRLGRLGLGKVWQLWFVGMCYCEVGTVMEM